METIVDKVYFREILIRDKRFLCELYKGNKLQNQNKISGASDSHLNTLCQILHLIMNNAIQVDYKNGEKIKDAKRLPFLKTISNRKINLQRSTKVHKKTK